MNLNKFLNEIVGDAVTLSVFNFLFIFEKLKEELEITQIRWHDRLDFCKICRIASDLVDDDCWGLIGWLIMILFHFEKCLETICNGFIHLYVFIYDIMSSHFIGFT